MKGLELAEAYWLEVAKPVFEKECPEVLTRAAIGLAGEGSECFGFDDEFSRDHDWGPGFCIWLNGDAMDDFGAKAQQVYASLPTEFMGYQRLRQNAQSAGRVGVQELGPFIYRYTGLKGLPSDWQQWCGLSENGLATVTNGKLFQDPVGTMTRVRTTLLNFYPEDVRQKKIATECALAAQSGQYNYMRCMRRGEDVSGMLAMTQFIDHVQALMFLLNKRYRPYYKWAHHAMKELPILGTEVGQLCEALVRTSENREENIEKISALLLEELKRQGLTDGNEDFLLPHADRIQSRIQNPALRAMHVMASI